MSEPDPRGPAQPGRGGDDFVRVVAGRALDLLVFAPAGALLSALDDPVGMATKGRARIEQELRNAKVVGRFAVDLGRHRVEHRLQDLLGSEGGTAATRSQTTAAGERGDVAAGDEAGPAARSASPGAEARVPPPPAVAVSRDAAVDRAIPDYDTLSASQVVRRLDGLRPDELRAVMRHELSGRSRRTIVNRCEQLLAGAPQDGPTG